MSREIRTAIITGGSGFVGSAVVERLLARHPQCKIYILDLVAPTPSPLGGKQIIHHAISILDSGALKAAFQKLRPQVVFHTAGLIPAAARRLKRPSRNSYIELNVQGTVNVFQACQKNGVEAFIYTSSVQAITASPWASYVNRSESSTPIPLTFTNYYAESKALAEQNLISLSDGSPIPKVSILRLSVLFGPGDTSLVPALYNTIHVPLGGNIILGKGENMYDITHVRNAAHAQVLAAENLLASNIAKEDSAEGQAFFISNLQPIRFRDFMLAVWAQFDYMPGWSMSIPAKLAYRALWSAERLARPFGGTLGISAGELADGCCDRWFDCTKAVKVLGYQPVIGLDEAVKDACDAYKLVLSNS